MSNKKQNTQRKGIEVASSFLDLTMVLRKDLVSKIRVDAVKRHSVSSCMLSKKDQL